MDKEAQELGGKAVFYQRLPKYAWQTNGRKLAAWTAWFISWSDYLVPQSAYPSFSEIFSKTLFALPAPELWIVERNKRLCLWTQRRFRRRFWISAFILAHKAMPDNFARPATLLIWQRRLLRIKAKRFAIPLAARLDFWFPHSSIFWREQRKSLTPDERKIWWTILLATYFADMVRLSKVNLYLHGFPSPTIFEYDTLSSEEKWDENFDVMLANPPFMSPKGGIKPHKRFSVQANRAEVLFVDYILEHLRPNGRAGIIVPEGIIFQSATAYKALRKLLIEEGFWRLFSTRRSFQSLCRVNQYFTFWQWVKKTKEILFLKFKMTAIVSAPRRK